MRETLKSLCGKTVTLLNPQCRYENCIFVLAHMRCGTTALSNVLCSRPDISGYGEAHIDYGLPDALGRLVVNQALRGGWTAGAPHLFDKILHNRHDGAVRKEFFRARAIFLARPPAATILSICKLFQNFNSEEYATPNLAAEYYIARLNALAVLWDSFPAERRVGLTHDSLLADPVISLARFSEFLQLTPPLENRYKSLKASRRSGGGDPMISGAFTSIRQRKGEPKDDKEHILEIPGSQRDAAESAYERLIAKF
jgi:hypothetical protein